MARKKGGKSKGFVSQGQRPNVSKWARNAARRDYIADDLAVVINKQKAWKMGKKVFLTIKNPAAAERSNEKFIRVPATDVWGSPNKRYIMKNNEG
tara:strand:- start:387 stop:671 length:285 start_codon:yes stop_codon:yes gene_type:complete